MTTLNHAYSAVSFISMVLILIPLPWHLESWNIGTCLYMIWNAVALLITFVNSIIWDGNALNSAVTWCDITTRISLGASIGVPAASLCIMRRLYYIANAKTTGMTKAERRRDVMIDLAIGLGIPILAMALYIIYQSNRFDIYEDFGCEYTLSTSWMTILLLMSWGIVIGTISAIYGALTIRSLAIRRAEFKAVLSTHNNLNSGRYYRLMALGLTDVLFTIPICCYYTYNFTIGGVDNFNWDYAHGGFWKVHAYPVVLWKANGGGTAIELSRWINVLGALIFFGFFGFSEEARKHYAPLWASSSRALGWSTVSFKSNSGATNSTNDSQFVGTLPKFVVKRETSAKKANRTNSITSFSSDISFDDKIELEKDDDSSSQSSSSLASPISPISPTDVEGGPPGIHLRDHETDDIQEIKV